MRICNYILKHIKMKLGKVEEHCIIQVYRKVNKCVNELTKIGAMYSLGTHILDNCPVEVLKSYVTSMSSIPM